MLEASIFHLISGLLYLIFLVYYIIKRKFSLQRHIVIILFLVYLNAVIAITLFPIPFDKRYIEDSIKYGFGTNFNFVPFIFIYDLKNNFARNFVPVFGNIALMMPLGYLIPLIFKRINNLTKVILAGLISAFSIETSQFLISFILGFKYRSVDIDDLILNTIGMLIGYLTLILMIPVIEIFFDLTLEIKPSGKRSNVQKVN